MGMNIPKIEKGVWKISTEPGLGVRLDESIMKKYQFKPGSGYRLPKK